MRGFTRHAAIKGLKAALEALIKMVERRFVYITRKTADLPIDCFSRSNKYEPTKQRIKHKESLNGAMINFKRGSESNLMDVKS